MKNKNYTYYLAVAPEVLHKYQWSRGLPISLAGAIVYFILQLCGQKPKDYKGICPYFEIGRNWGGFGMGWFFVCCKNCSDITKNHEIGHCIQNAAVGGLTMIGYSIASAIRYWWRKLHRVKTSYDSWFFEGDATRIGMAYVQRIECQTK